jgi:FKBP-type peptidyl-prolyl cis-trans isomerase FkpA
MKLLVGLAIVVASVAGCSGGNSSGSPTAPSANVSFSATELRPGTGAEATTGRNVTVNYTGWIYNAAAVDNKGTRFDTGTFSFVVGQGVIQGFSMGVNGMRVGGLRRVVIPPNLGYGNNPPPGSPIRANETLIFEIELVAVQ